MFSDPIYLRHRDVVWPLFWPVFVLAIVAFRARARRLMARGCLSLGYEVTAYGAVWITDTVFPGDRDWKDGLYAATGAYGSSGTLAGLATALARPAGGDASDCAGNIVYVVRAFALPEPRQGARGRARRIACLLAGLPRPAT